MTVRRVARLLAGAALVVVSAAGCGGTNEGTPEAEGPSPSSAVGDIVLPTPSPTFSLPPGETEPAAWKRCYNPPGGYSVAYPEEWYTVEGQYLCRFFHPEPFTIPENSEFPLLALNVEQTQYTIAEYRAIVTDPMYYTTVLNEDVTILGRPGVRFETVATGEGLNEAGTRRYGYLIDHGGGKALVVWTVALPSESRYDSWKSIVDVARDTVRFLHPNPEG